MKNKFNKKLHIILVFIIVTFMIMTDIFTAISNWKLTLICFASVILFGVILLYIIILFLQTNHPKRTADRIDIIQFFQQSL